MKLTKNRNSEVTRGLHGAVLLVLAAGLGFASCSQIVDSDDGPQTKASETNVKNFYYKIEKKDAQYRYSLTSKNAYLPASDVLVMNMEGYEDYTTPWHGMPVCQCDWAYEITPGSTPWYYAMSEDSIVALGVDYNGYTDSWVELKAPLQQDAKWDFTSQGEMVHARIAKYGVSAAVAGKRFNDVMIVEYRGDSGTVGTTWFQRDTGVIYSHLVRPQTDEHIDLQFKSMTDK